MMATALLHGNRVDVNSDQFVVNIVMAILANFRLVSERGFCPSSLSINTLNQNGWKFYWNSQFQLADPHYESWIWCSFLWAFNVSGYQPLFDRTVHGLENMMNAFYSGQLRWANGLTQEYSRLLLPLSFLNRVEAMSNKTHLKWLKDIGNELKMYFVNGTIIEHFGNLSNGNARPPQSNQQYGSSEAPLEQENGDTVSDTLYTLPFAVWGLHEAYLLTKDSLFGGMLSDLTMYLMETQVFVEEDKAEHSYLNGSWLRGFDFERKEYFGSSSDIGWGPYSVESGWTVGEILSAFGMIMTNTSFFDVVNAETLPNFEALLKKNVPIFGLPPFDS